MSNDRFNSSSYINFEQRLALRQKDDDTYLVSKEVWHQPKTVQFRKDEGIAAFRVNTKTQEERVNDKMSSQCKFDPDNSNFCRVMTTNCVFVSIYSYSGWAQGLPFSS